MNMPYHHAHFGPDGHPHPHHQHRHYQQRREQPDNKPGPSCRQFNQFRGGLFSLSALPFAAAKFGMELNENLNNMHRSRSRQFGRHHLHASYSRGCHNPHVDPRGSTHHRSRDLDSRRFKTNSTNSNINPNQMPHAHDDDSRIHMHKSSNKGKSNKETNESFRPSLDVYESKDSFIIYISLPGVARENIDIDFDLVTQILTIKGVTTRPEEFESKKAIVRRSEGSYGRFTRALRFSRYSNNVIIDDNKITAKLENGLLILELPKLKQPNGKKVISIESDSEESGKENEKEVEIKVNNNAGTKQSDKEKGDGNDIKVNQVGDIEERDASNFATSRTASICSSPESLGPPPKYDEPSSSPVIAGTSDNDDEIYQLSSTVDHSTSKPQEVEVTKSKSKVPLFLDLEDEDEEENWDLIDLAPTPSTFSMVSDGEISSH